MLGFIKDWDEESPPRIGAREGKVKIRELKIRTHFSFLSPEEYLLTPNLEQFNMQIKACIKIRR